MTFLPIVGRELRVAARRTGTYGMRCATALAALAGGFWIYVLTYREAAQETGLALFVALSVLANVFAILVGLRSTADCLSEEKREGTLGLLFLTDLRGYDIVLGKLAATSLNAFYGLLATFPILGISVMMGGVTIGEFGRVVLVSVNNLLFSLAVGMLCSSISRDDRRALGGTFLVLLLAAGLPLAGMLIKSLGHQPGPPNLAFFLPSPSFTCFTAFDAIYSQSRGAQSFWVSAALVHGLAWLCLGAAAWITPRTWQERATAGRQGFNARWRQWLCGSPDQRAERRHRLLDINPMLWLTSRERFKELWILAALAGLGLFWLWGYHHFGRDWVDMVPIPFALCAHTLLKVGLSGEACRRFSEDRRSGALELLLAAPLDVETILRGQRLALWRQFARPTLVVLLADAALMLTGYSFAYSEGGSWVMLWLVGAGMLVWDLHALSWVSPWMGLNSRNPNRASLAALARICSLPWLAFGALIALYGFFEAFLGFRYHLSERLVLAGLILGWAALGAAANLIFGGWARLRLTRDFREIATRRFETAPRSGDWGRVLGEWLRGKR